MRIKLVLMMMCASILFAQKIPNSTGYVNDFANALYDGEEVIMYNIIYNYEKETSIEISIVTQSNLQGEVIEEYANELFNTWGIGKRYVDDGVLIFLSLDSNDRGLRIEVGYGLEEFLTDAQCSHIINDVMPLLKEGNYSKAVLNTLYGVKEQIGDGTKEMREQHLAKLKQEEQIRKEEGLKILFIILLILGIAGFCFGGYLLLVKLKSYFAYKKQAYLSAVKSIESLKTATFEARQSIIPLIKQGFYGSVAVDNSLKSYDSEKISPLEKRLKKNSKVKELEEILSYARLYIDEIHDISNDLISHNNIAMELKNNTERVIEHEERLINKALPEARQMITTINEKNPISVWRGFDYIHFDRSIENFINTAKDYHKNAIKMLDINDYHTAEKYTNFIYKSLNDAKKVINFIFDADKEIKAGMQMYQTNYVHIKKLKDDAHKAMSVEYVDNNTKSGYKKADDYINDLSKELSQPKPDWILVGALIVNIITALRNIIYQSEEDVKSHHRKIREKEESYRRSRISSSSSSNSGGGGFGGFGGGHSGGGGATGRF
jgi:uncharacterized membrane protein YgcG